MAARSGLARRRGGPAGAAVFLLAVFRRGYQGASALIDPIGVTVFGGGDRAAVLSVEVD